MNDTTMVQTNDRWILNQRPVKNRVNPLRPYNYLVEKEHTEEGIVECVATIFLTNNECPFHCLMCDLWKNTLDKSVPNGAIPTQIKWALDQIPPVEHIKLYNSGSFFDPQAIPPNDFPEIANLLGSFKSVVIESHPRLVKRRCLPFLDLLKPKLYVAMGVETVHPQILKKLNKSMTLEDFEKATNYLFKKDILVRTFILLPPPFLNEAEGIIWAKHSIDFAFNIGVECCVIIPTRMGNGALDQLHSFGLFSPPNLKSLEEVLAYGIQLKLGRVFADLWDVEKLSSCDKCHTERLRSIHRMNINQALTSPIHCNCSKTC